MYQFEIGTYETCVFLFFGAEDDPDDEETMRPNDDLASRCSPTSRPLTPFLMTGCDEGHYSVSVGASGSV